MKNESQVSTHCTEQHSAIINNENEIEWNLHVAHHRYYTINECKTPNVKVPSLTKPSICFITIDGRLHLQNPVKKLVAYNMPHWEGIEDASAVPEPVWLARPCSSNSNNDAQPVAQEWKPLRKTDCLALNNNEKTRKLILKEEQSIVTLPTQNESTKSMRNDAYCSKKWCINIEGGRCKADPVMGRIYYNFTRGVEKEMVSATWFVKEDKSSNETILHPVSILEDSDKIEALYQQAIASTSSFGAGIDSILKEEVILSDESKVFVNKNGEILTMQKKASTAGWFGPSNTLQRGYGPYEVVGEENEKMLGPVKHLVFIVHGIGEAFFTQAKYVKLSSILEQTEQARLSIQRKQVEEFQKQKIAALKSNSSSTDSKNIIPPNRIELIPIEWYSRIHDSSSALMKSLQLTTLTTIPALRSIANDVVFDILLYMTPAFCESVLECVTQQLNDTYEVFKQVHPNFESSGGKVSLAGHSLGSVIVWDLLAILKDSMLNKGDSENNMNSLQSVAIDDHDSTHKSNEEVGYRAYAREKHANTSVHGTWGPSLTKPLTKIIHFRPECTLFLGSPLGLFLPLRGAHPVFDEMRKYDEAQRSEMKETTLTVHDKRNPKESVIPLVPCPFTLPTEKLYNIFHPSDPVAYRLEPLLLPVNLNRDALPPPVYLKPPGQDLRFHLKFKQKADDFTQMLSTRNGSWKTFFDVAAHALGTSTSKDAEDAIKFPLGGKNGRIDCSLQPGVIDNEYISAVMAHGCYLTHSDFQDFLISLLSDDDVSL